MTGPVGSVARAGPPRPDRSASPDRTDRVTPAAPVGETDTPRLLARWQAVGTAIVVAFGAASLALQFLGWSADGRAADDTEQLLRVQEVRASLLRADALATDAFLAEDAAPGPRGEYDAAVASALAGITDAARAQPADGPELAALTIAVTDYLTATARAGDADRAAGAVELAEASALLRQKALPILTSLMAENAERARAAMDAHQPELLLVTGLVALAALARLHHRLAVTFRRHLNLGVLLAGLVLLLATTVTVVAGFAADSANDDLRVGAFGTAADQAAARAAAHDAHAREGERLLRRMRGAEAEQGWDEAAEIVRERGAAELAPLWQEYAADHAAIVAAAQAGDWVRAAELARPEATDPLDRYDDASQRLIADAAAEATGEWRDDRWVAVLIAALTLVAVALAVAALARGIGQRRREFS